MNLASRPIRPLLSLALASLLTGADAPSVANTAGKGGGSIGSRPVPGQNFRLTAPDIEFIWVAPGTFRRGSDKGRPNEKPVHTVTLTKGYWLAKTEVTQAQWRAPREDNPSSFKGDDRPVETIGHDGFSEHCIQLNERERAAKRVPDGYAYAMPTEAAWEFACRAGAEEIPVDAIRAMAWIDENAGGTTHPVATRRPNAWGFFDLHGTVWEVCLGKYSADDRAHAGSANVKAPIESGDDYFCVARGGGWGDSVDACRPSFRLRISMGFNQAYYLGFRVALSTASGW